MSTLTPESKSLLSEPLPAGTREVVLRGGEYRGLWHFPREWSDVEIRPAPGEVVRFVDPDWTESPDHKASAQVWIGGSRVRVRGVADGGRIEVQGSGQPQTTNIGGVPAIRVQGVAATDSADDVRIENVRCRDTGGVNIDHRSKRARLYGVICTGTGVDGADRGHGHGFYCQSDATDWLALRHCVVADGYAAAFNLYGSSARKARNVRLDECIAVCPSSRSQRDKVAPCVYFGSEDGAADGLVIERGLYYNAGSYPAGGGYGHAAIQLGVNHVNDNGSASFVGVTIGGPLHLVEPFALSISGCDLFWRPGTGRPRPVLDDVRGERRYRYDADNREIVAVGRGDGPIPNGRTRVEVLPNEYADERALIWVHNAEDLPSIEVDLSRVCREHGRYVVERLDTGATREITYRTPLVLDLEDDARSFAAGLRAAVFEVRPV